METIESRRMIFANSHDRPVASAVARRGPLSFCSLLLLTTLLAAGCQKAFFQVDDPQLKPIQEMIETQLPQGCTSDRVTTFISVRGYEMQAPEKPGTLVAVIRHIDIQTVRPVTARVTFYFDANGRLNAVEMTRIPNQPIE
ncbi:MAG: hypothetical protein ACHP78_20045 [Terriglobales bacterium]